MAVYETDNTTHNPDKAGKKVFISFALPGEAVLVKMTNSKKNFEEGDAYKSSIIPIPSVKRHPAHILGCGGCSLQHWQADAQIDFKQSVLKELLIHQAGIEPDICLSLWLAIVFGYRTKAPHGCTLCCQKRLGTGRFS